MLQIILKNCKVRILWTICMNGSSFANKTNLKCVKACKSYIFYTCLVSNKYVVKKEQKEHNPVKKKSIYGNVVLKVFEGILFEFDNS